jgi:hypothetical protein
MLATAGYSQARFNSQTRFGAPQAFFALTCRIQARFNITHHPADGRLTKRRSQPLAVSMFSFPLISTLKSVTKLAAASGG